MKHPFILGFYLCTYKASTSATIAITCLPQVKVKPLANNHHKII